MPVISGITLFRNIDGRSKRTFSRGIAPRLSMQLIPHQDTIPVLRNVRHEKFAQALADGAAVPEAYERAGYAPGVRAAAAAARLYGKAELKARVAEIKSRSAAPAEASVARILDELEEARRLAIEIKQPAAAISAIMGKARISGMLTEKAEGKAVTTLYFELSETEAARRIAFILRRSARLAPAEVPH